MKWFASALCGIGLAVILAGPAAAESKLEQIRSAGVLRIGTEGTYPPFTYHDADGKLEGFDVEIGREIARRIGVQPRFLEGKWDGLIAGLDADRYDAVINEVGITPEREHKYDFSEPYIASKAVLIVRTGNEAIKGFADLKGRTAAESLTSNYAQLAREDGATLIGTDGFDQSIQLVVQGRADATLNDSLSFLDFKKKRPDAPVRIVAQEDKAGYSGVIIRKGEPELLAAINKALDAMKADGTYAKISARYFGQDVSR